MIRSTTPHATVLAAENAGTPETSETLAQACNALWLATLSLMTAFMQIQAPAHRHLIACRIARNFETLHQQDCFSTDTRRVFLKLSRQWADRARHLTQGNDQSNGLLGRLRDMLLRLR